MKDKDDSLKISVSFSKGKKAYTISPYKFLGKLILLGNAAGLIGLLIIFGILAPPFFKRNQEFREQASAILQSEADQNLEKKFNKIFEDVEESSKELRKSFKENHFHPSEAFEEMQEEFQRRFQGNQRNFEKKRKERSI